MTGDVGCTHRPVTCGAILAGTDRPEVAGCCPPPRSPAPLFMDITSVINSYPRSGKLPASGAFPLSGPFVNESINADGACSTAINVLR